MLQQVFQGTRSTTQNETAAAYLRRNRKAIRDIVCHWTGQDKYVIDQILAELIERGGELKLRTVGRNKPSRLDVAALVTRQLIDSLYARRPILAL
jgi:hypothetical protein